MGVVSTHPAPLQWASSAPSPIFYFAVNTLLRNKAYRGKAFFIRRSFGGQAYKEVTPDKLLAMGKAQMSRILCAYEGNQPGSAAEKLAQRNDLEAMIHQLEEEWTNPGTW